MNYTNLSLVRIGVFMAFAWTAGSLSAASSIDRAERLLARGSYEEAAELFAEHQADDPIGAALGSARCLAAVGQTDRGCRILEAALEKHADDARAADVYAELATLAFRRGDYTAARRRVTGAFRKNAEQPAARWIDAELHRVHGRLDEADRAYRNLADRFRRDPKSGDAAELCLVARAAAQRARWHRDSRRFSWLVNQLLPEALARDENCWQAHWLSGLLFLEKYNRADARRELDAAVAINPNAAEVHAARALLFLHDRRLDLARESLDRALAVNPRLPGAHRIRAMVLFGNFRVDQAIEVLEEAQGINPADEETLGWLAAARAAREGLTEAHVPESVQEIISEATKRNPKCGTFYFSLAAGLDSLNKFTQAALYYREATEVMPQLVGPRGRLGMLLMRLGREEEAARLLEDSFRIDPFNVRVKNTLEVLDVLKDYETIETRHFVIKFDGSRDRLLARCAVDYLERVAYPELVERLGFEPPEKTLIEIFSQSGGTSGHGWFSARMVGLPNVGTVAACAGKMVAMVSPSEMGRPLNWARIVRHEFVHVITLQQTDFNIPHWLTEGLAVWHEEGARPPQWTALLARRTEADTLLTLDSIDAAFVYPGGQGDRQLAYCQAELYVEFALEAFGPDAPARLLAAYASNRSADEAIRESFEMEPAEFERRYKQFVLETIRPVIDAGRQDDRSIDQLRQTLAENADDADAAARLARLLLDKGEMPEARRLALAARKADPKNKPAGYVLAKLHLSIGERDEAVAVLKDDFDADSADSDALALLARLAADREDYARAIELYNVGVARFGHDPAWLKSLARVLLLAGREEPLAGVLERLAALDEDNLVVRKKLAQLAAKRDDWPVAETWARRGLYIDVNDAGLHAALARACLHQDRRDEAIHEFRTAIELDSNRAEWRFELARCYAAVDQKQQAADVLEELLELAPDHQQAKSLLETLKRD